MCPHRPNMEIFETVAGFCMSAQRKPELYDYAQVTCWLRYVHPAYTTMGLLTPLIVLACRPQLKMSC